MTRLYFSESNPPATWSASSIARDEFGPKGAGLMMLPRAWTLPFVLVSASRAHGFQQTPLAADVVEWLGALAGSGNWIIIRSSVIGETIWDRGTYKSLSVDLSAPNWQDKFQKSCAEVIGSAGGRPCALVLQRYLEPKQRGEFGNLLRISKTRDQWEITTHEQGRAASFRINTQRDATASPKATLTAKPRLPRERLFGSIGAWVNNELLRSRSARLNIEWISDNVNFYLVQVDEEGPDLSGVNPLQIAITPVHKSEGGSGQFIHFADRAAIDHWDKLRVLDELWAATDPHKPNLFYLLLTNLPATGDAKATAALVREFERLLGPDYIMVRTSVRRTDNKPLNLPRTPNCLTPTEAAAWCLAKRDAIAAESSNLTDYAFITHRFIDARVGTWARATPGDPMVEIHGLWGLPDALQYCPYDSWEIHLPTETATEYTEYKSNFLRCQSDGSWSYLRVRNELARSLCIAKKDAMDVARRTREIADRLGKACHVMWFIGCLDQSGEAFNTPWYWVPAHSVVNQDRTRHLPFIVHNRVSLEELARANFDKTQYMIVLRAHSPRAVPRQCLPCRSGRASARAQHAHRSRRIDPCARLLPAD